MPEGYRHCVQVAKEINSKSIGLCLQGSNSLGVVLAHMLLRGRVLKKSLRKRPGSLAIPPSH
jgi:hypothetical protein